MTLTVRLHAATQAKLDRLSRRLGLTKSELVREALRAIGDSESARPTGNSLDGQLALGIGCARGGPPDLSARTGVGFRRVLARRKAGIPASHPHACWRRSALGAAMVDKLTLRLPAALSCAVTRDVEKRGVTKSHVVRMALLRYLEEEATTDLHPFDRVKDLIGSIRSGIPDLGTRHRAHLVRRLRLRPVPRNLLNP